MRSATTTLVLAAGLACVARTAAADPAPAGASGVGLLAPPPHERPVEVRARFELRDVNRIDDGAETFEFAGVLTLEWRDPRQAFEPELVGVDEKIFQGGYQFDELATGWYPQVVLVNESGLFQKSGTLLRVRPDGSSRLVETVNAVARTEFDLHRFPFDRHRLEAVFEVLGYASDEVRLVAAAETATGPATRFRVPEWTASSFTTSIQERPGGSPAFVLSVDVDRDSFYFVRLIIVPQLVIALLSFSVFWMDQSSVGDRMGISFIGVLTAVTYQLVINESMPPVSYATFMHAFLSLSFLVMSATIPINLTVGVLDRQAKRELGDRIDRRCRLLFPFAYFALVMAAFLRSFAL